MTLGMAPRLGPDQERAYWIISPIRAPSEEMGKRERHCVRALTRRRLLGNSTASRRLRKRGITYEEHSVREYTEERNYQGIIPFQGHFLSRRRITEEQSSARTLYEDTYYYGIAMRIGPFRGDGLLGSSTVPGPLPRRGIAGEQQRGRAPSEKWDNWGMAPRLSPFQ